MPVYEYICLSCNNCIEQTTSSYKESKKIITCPSCGGDAVKIPSATSFILEGEGWAKDGYTYKNKEILKNYDSGI